MLHNITETVILRAKINYVGLYKTSPEKSVEPSTQAGILFLGDMPPSYALEEIVIAS